MPAKPYESERLILSQTDLDDAEVVLAVMNTPKWIQFIGDRNVRSIEEAKAYIEAKYLPQLHRLGYSNFTLIRKSDGVNMGFCGLYDREGVEGLDIGFALLPEHEGKGYAYEASRELLDRALGEWEISVVSAITTKDNTASQRLLEKLGLNRIGFITLPKDTEELLLYRIQRGNT